MEDILREDFSWDENFLVHFNTKQPLWLEEPKVNHVNTNMVLHVKQCRNNVRKKFVDMLEGARRPGKLLRKLLEDNSVQSGTAQLKQRKPRKPRSTKKSMKKGATSSQTARKFKLNDCTVENKLDLDQKELFDTIFTAVSNNPKLLYRYKKFSPDNTGISGRKYYFFASMFANVFKLGYHVDYTEYPHRIIGEFNDPNDETALAAKETGRDVIYVNVFASYCNMTRWNGTGFSPHARGLKCVREDNSVWPLATWNFFLWFDSVAGYEAFDRLRDQMEKEKHKADAEAQLRRENKKKGIVPERKKRHNFDAQTLAKYRTVSHILLNHSTKLNLT